VSGNDDYAGPLIWDKIFINHEQAGSELNPDGWWLPRYPTLFEQFRLDQVVDLGCGIGADAVALAKRGYNVTALDFSTTALDRARRRAKSYHIPIVFLQADFAYSLPFKEDVFDGVMSNVALHMFSESVTRRLFREIYRILRPGGLFMFHVNSVDDMTYRAKRFPRIEQIEPYFFLEEHGQTMHFFSEEYCRTLLETWDILSLQHLNLADENDEVFKCVWQCIAQKQAAG
jgi:SAM-dependent methyltransferase